MLSKYLSPKYIFLADALGALLSALLLGVVLPQLESYIGMPTQTLYLLAGVALVFCLYSGTCHLLAGRNWRMLLTIIAIANFLYCCLTASMVVYHWSVLTTLGVVYFLMEKAIILLLVMIEVKTIQLNK